MLSTPPLYAAFSIALQGQLPGSNTSRNCDLADALEKVRSCCSGAQKLQCEVQGWIDVSYLQGTHSKDNLRRGGSCTVPGRRLHVRLE